MHRTHPISGLTQVAFLNRPCWVCDTLHRFVVVCGDGEYIIHTALNLRNKAFGQALDFVWSPDSHYAIRETSSKIKVFKNFKEKMQIKIDFSAEGIFGGQLLGIKGGGSLSFYSWETGDLVRRIDVDTVSVNWNDSGDYVAVGTDESFYVLKYDADAVAEAMNGEEEIDEDEGIEDALVPEGEIDEVIKTAKWVGDCFIYTNTANRLNYYVGKEIVTISHLDRPMYLLGYLGNTSRLYLCDKEVNIISFALQLSVLEYQTAVMRGDHESADELLKGVPKDQRTRVAHFLEKQGFKEQALVVSLDPEHRFELAISLQRLAIAREMAEEIGAPGKWKQLGEIAMRQSKFDLAEECMEHAKDYSGLLLLYTSAGKYNKLGELADTTQNEEKTNIAFMALLLQGKIDECVDLLIKTERLAEATLFARSYAPSRVSATLALWKEDLGKTNPKAAGRLASPEEYGNLFSEMEFTKGVEAQIRASNASAQPAAQYAELYEARKTPLEERVSAAGGDAPQADDAAAEPVADDDAMAEAADDAAAAADDTEAEAEADVAADAEAEADVAADGDGDGDDDDLDLEGDDDDGDDDGGDDDDLNLEDDDLNLDSD